MSLAQKESVPIFSQTLGIQLIKIIIIILLFKTTVHRVTCLLSFPRSCLGNLPSSFHLFMRIYVPIIGFVINHLIIRFTNALINMLCCVRCFISSVLRLNLCIVFLQNVSKLKAIRAKQ